ncbi:polyketide synthase [Mycobacterium bohemicum DSM 44277]|uniref:Acyltransferase n=2 Tax=Mycobacterium bohemicum TaxID=56425 RepID=A0A1X1QW12_MYCBE|nr:condensation domain-containing protein [Mycobacterium bohemicum]MCV6971701.1 acyltransferase [Mycobacterium bohemicum]ORU95565.1 acyltransferase [Mycobacterium bohemicum]CPR10831.1 polyketide synthase [Mycobacterium bohemicum DSM 44277]
MLIGPLDVSTVNEWEPAAGTLVSWRASAASLAAAREAPASAVPPSYVQARHLRSFREQAARGLEHSRLLIASAEVPGRCDLRAMTYVINKHLRRHDTYRSWFEFSDSGDIVRHTIAEPDDIEFLPVEQGELSTAELRDQVVATPDSLHWDCFSFGVIQRPDGFTFYASLDHLHADGQFIGVGLLEFQTMYAEVVTGKPPIGLPGAGSYEAFCVRQHEQVRALTADSPEVRAWVEFAEANDGTYPKFPLPLGDPDMRCGGDLMTATLMDERQTERFEDACVAAGARFIGGMFACIALALHQLTGSGTYFAITPTDTRTPDDLMTQGWFTGHVPITVPVAGSCFNEMARAGQSAFDSGAGLASVPFERVVELAPRLRNPPPLFALVNFFDAQVGPLSMLAKLFDGRTVGGHSDGRLTYPLSTMVGRFHQTAAGVLFPDNPVARDSVARYLGALKSACVRVAEGGAAERDRTVAPLPRQAVS